MIRLIHNQTVQGALLVDDIDDGLPNKAVYRLGSLGNPKQYERDGYANKPKQGCYIPYSHTAPNGSAVPGFITLQQTNRVTSSLGKGKIFKLSSTPLATLPGGANFPLVTLLQGLTAAQFAVPVITSAPHGTNPVVITGTTFLSVTPDVTSITFARGSGLTTPSVTFFTQSTVGVTVLATTISITAAAFGAQVPVAGNLVTVTSNEQVSNTYTMT